MTLYFSLVGLVAAESAWYSSLGCLWRETVLLRQVRCDRCQTSESDSKILLQKIHTKDNGAGKPAVR